MKKRWLVVMGVAALLVAVGLTGCAGSTGIGGESPISVSLNNQQEGVWVTGQGKVSAVPDLANLRLGVSAQSPSVAQAQAQASEAMNKVMAVLESNGVAKKDIQTQYFNIQQVTRWDESKQQEIVVGYRVTNTVNAKIRELDKAGTIIDAVAEAGGDLTRIDSVSFSIDDPTGYQEQAREKALADARAKAEQIARLSGITLGKPTYISESFYIPVPVYPVREAAGDASASTPISPGEMEVSLTVQVVYSIR